MLSLDVSRCQGATGGYGAPGVTGSALCSDCIDCQRRTDIRPGYAHHYMKPPVWFAFLSCPNRIGPATEVDA